MSAVIEISHASKTFKRRRRPALRALSGLELTVESGGVHGFLGPNGSGKTTTIRALLGLISLDDGEMRLLGEPVPKRLPVVIGGVGALVEAPLFFNNFSGRLNLEILARTARVESKRIDECLDLVGLADRADDAYKGYSLGMRHRLGVAAALLKSPRLLILDEPTNGLDPAGIVELREMLRTLGQDGRTTVFFSSHQLGEVQQICDHVSILVSGRCVTSGSVAEVLRSRGTGEHVVRVANSPQATTVLTNDGLKVRTTGEHLMVSGADQPERITRLLAAHDLYVSELYPVSGDLESVFLELTREAEAAGGGAA